MKVNSGDVAVIGGLMQDEKNESTRGVPGLSRVPYLGSLFKYKGDSKNKTELVIFIKPVVIKHASLERDLKDYKAFYNNLELQ